MQWTFDQSRPIYQQIIDGIKRSVARGELQPGDQIPSQREMAQSAQVNPNTVQRAYREMEQMGLVKTMRGQGTFISVREGMISTLRREMAQEALQEFVHAMKGLGFSREETVELVSQEWDRQKGR